MNKKIKLVIEIVIFVLVLGIIGAVYYYNVNKKEVIKEAGSVGIVKITDSNFEEEVLNSDKTVILDFSSNSCPPCVGAFLSSALILASTAGSVFKGALLLLLYSLGLVIPFIITTLFLEKMKLTFDFIKKHYNIINKLSGSLLIIFGLFNVIQGILGVI